MPDVTLLVHGLSETGESQRLEKAVSRLGFVELVNADSAKELLAVEFVYAYPKWSAPALYAAGRSFERLGQKDLARQQYETVVTKYKDEAEPAKLARVRLEELKRG